MNHYLKSQIDNMTMIATTFEKSCKLAVMQDDGQISKDEAKTLKKIEAATEKFIKELNSLLK